MKKFSKLLSAVFALAATLLFGMGCGGTKKDYTVVISIPSADHGWTGGVVSWAEKAKKDIEVAHPEVEVVVIQSKDSQSQVSAIEAQMLKKIDALVLLPNEPRPLTEVCRKVKKAGIKLVVVDRQLEEDLSDLAVLGDNHQFGVEAAKAMGKELNGNGKIIVLEGIPCNVNTDRVKGFRETLKDFPGIEILNAEGTGRTDWDQQQAQKVMENMLQMYDHIDAVWAGDDDVLAGALPAIEKAQRKDIKLMIGGGGSKYVVKKIMDKDPVVRLTVTYPPGMIYKAAMEALGLYLEKRNEFPQKKIVIPSVPVTSENAKDFYMPDSKY